jgi:5'-phosphate synthase pdxT subunit
VLGRRGGDPVLVRSGSIVAATFHPELGVDRRVHNLFRRLLEDRNA